MSTPVCLTIGMQGRKVLAAQKMFSVDSGNSLLRGEERRGELAGCISDEGEVRTTPCSSPVSLSGHSRNKKLHLKWLATLQSQQTNSESPWEDNAIWNKYTHPFPSLQFGDTTLCVCVLLLLDQAAWGTGNIPYTPEKCHNKMEQKMGRV